ncbi:alpha/beta hydrolase [Phanerochaete sordida]|uniref:Alpha/beta hydrolase n=1 Tax=Phanerochaete sordida TaxID=48140 RepID=A0A9P3LEI5_9APHY|nr:alpha/beta hydrolase [Phanerochaete sordida]
MPTAQLNTQGTVIFYHDSGPPKNCAVYTTVVLVHGFAINGGIFERMLPHAATYGFRIIAMNSRDYSGSTPYTPDELSDYTSHNLDKQAAAVRRWAHEIGCFLVHVCSSLRIPRARALPRGQIGGLIMVAWSLSTMAALAMLGDARSLGEELSSQLALYLRKVILYDPSSRTAGVHPDLLLTWPVADPTIPPEEKPAKFNEWVSSYFTAHPDDAPITVEALHARTALPRTPTLLKLTSAELHRVTNPEILLRSGLIVNTDSSIHLRHARTTFSDADAVLPRVEVIVWWCDCTFWMALWGAKVFAEFIKEEPSAGKRKRSASMLKLKDANHFLHWEEPERMVRLLAEACHGSMSLARL